MTSLPVTPIEVRLARRLVPMPNGCIEWTGAKFKTGYGAIRAERGTITTHRLAWEIANGPIPDGLHVLHGCDNRPCCNPEHLSVGTNADNVADMVSKGRHHNQRKTHCPQGHEYSPENTIDMHYGRRCATCRSAQNEKSIVARRIVRQAAKEARRNHDIAQ